MPRHSFRDHVSPDGLTLTETVVKINRCAAVVKGGRRFSFSALLTVGDQAGVVGLGFGKAKMVPNAVEKGVKLEVPNPTYLIISGPDKQKVGQFAAEIRSQRKPEPYKGKGIRYRGEHIQRKAGKSFVGSD
jgi:hypothetical protein